MKTQGHKVLVTGGSSGIGLAIATRLLAENTVVIAGRDEPKLAAARERHPTLLTRRLDVTDEAESHNVVADLAAELGGLSLLVNSAGAIAAYGLADDRAARLAERDVATNFLGSVRLTRLALPFLRQADEAAVVFISSVVAIAPAPGFAIYSATKAAVHSLARSLRDELAGQVRVFDVLPTWVDTDSASALNVTKLAPETVADALVQAMARDRYEVFVGRAGIVAWVNRLSPGLADNLVRRATVPQ